MPGEHTGEAFSFGLTFSEELDNDFSYRTLRDEAFNVTGGAVRKAKRRQSGSNLGWTITVEPDSDTTVTIRLPKTTDCDAGGALCTDDGTAAAGEDYTATSGTLAFPAGDTSKTISVAVLDDSHDEDEETLTLRLSNPLGGRLTDGEATGTIENRDPLPRAFMARFGRTVAVQVVEQVEERIKAPRQAGFQGRFAGRQVGRGLVSKLAVEFLNRFGANRYGAGLHTPMAGGGAASLGMPGFAGGEARMAGGAGSMCLSPDGGGGPLQTPGLAGGAPMAADPMGSMPATHGGLDTARTLRGGLRRKEPADGFGVPS